MSTTDHQLIDMVALYWVQSGRLCARNNPPAYLSHGCTEMNQHIWPQQPLLQSRMGMWVPKWSPCVHVCTDRPCLGGNGHYGQAHGIAILLVSYMVGYNNIVELDLSDTCIVKLSQGQGTPGTISTTLPLGYITRTTL